MKQESLLKLYEQAGALLHGHFVLSSGRHSARYLQSALVLMHPQHAATLAAELAALVDAENIDMVVSPALGGLIIGHEVAHALNKPLIFTERKEGEMQLRRGFSIPQGARLLVVEDVITTGGSVRECMTVVREHGGTPIQVLAVVDRAPDMKERFDVPYQTVIQLDVETFAADACPLCAAGTPAVKPGSRLMRPFQLRCFPFGGVGEFGKNLMIYAWDDDAVMVDCGMGFPAPGQHGVDVVIPDLTALKTMGLTLHALLLTHGHEDHIGGVPFILPQLGDIPVYGSPVTLALVQAKLDEQGHKGDLRALDLEGKLDVGPFQVEAIPVTHSIMDAVSLAIHTPAGAIVHTGDFRFDPSPVDGRATPLHRFSRLSDEGVLLLASDSTNATRSGSAPSERSVAPALRQAIAGCTGKVIVTTFASNMFRIQQIIDAACAAGRSVALAGRSLEKNVNITRDLERLNIPGGSLIDFKQIDALADRQLLIIATGSQGEWRAALARIAQNRHPKLRLSAGDLVIFSSSAIPGNERVIAGLYNHIYRRGARILHARQAALHVSGHAHAHELKMMMQLTRPRYFYPVHGEYRNLVEHQQLAVAAGIPFEHTVIAENGQSVVVNEQGIRRSDGFHAGAVFVDGASREELDDLVLRDRRVLAEDGIISVTVVLSRHEGQLLMSPDLVARGVMHEDLHEDVLDRASDELATFIGKQDKEFLADLDQVEEEVRIWLRRWCKRHLKRRPMVLPTVVEV